MEKNKIRVAIATNDGERIGEGHFAHNTHFIILDIDPNEVQPVELRENPLGFIPDLDHHMHHSHDQDMPEAIHPELARRLHEFRGLHGVEKYRKLKETLLNDVDLIVAGGACMTSIKYFTSEGVKLIFADPGEPIRDIAGFLTTVNYKELPAVVRLKRTKDQEND